MPGRPALKAATVATVARLVTRFANQERKSARKQQMLIKNKPTVDVLVRLGYNDLSARGGRMARSPGCIRP